MQSAHRGVAYYSIVYNKQFVAYLVGVTLIKARWALQLTVMKLYLAVFVD